MTRGLKLYKSYVFIDKDPIIDTMRTIVEDSGKTYAKVRTAGDATTCTASLASYLAHGSSFATSGEQVFVDTSPNQSRRYCSDRCSSRANVAAYRARRRSAVAL